MTDETRHEATQKAIGDMEGERRDQTLGNRAIPIEANQRHSPSERTDFLETFNSTLEQYRQLRGARIPPRFYSPTTSGNSNNNNIHRMRVHPPTNSNHMRYPSRFHGRRMFRISSLYMGLGDEMDSDEEHQQDDRWPYRRMSGESFASSKTNRVHEQHYRGAGESEATIISSSDGDSSRGSEQTSNSSDSHHSECNCYTCWRGRYIRFGHINDPDGSIEFARQADSFLIQWNSPYRSEDRNSISLVTRRPRLIDAEQIDPMTIIQTQIQRALDELIDFVHLNPNETDMDTFECWRKSEELNKIATDTDCGDQRRCVYHPNKLLSIQRATMGTNRDNSNTNWELLSEEYPYMFTPQTQYRILNNYLATRKYFAYMLP
ncbi:hypothetical protein ACOME3_004813 [Neoechinorhynchus agilis]